MTLDISIPLWIIKAAAVIIGVPLITYLAFLVWAGWKITH
jgi:hypothetical protein